MKKKLKLTAAVVAIFLCICIGGFIYVSFWGHRNIETETPEYMLTAKTINADFVRDVNKSNQKYLNKAVAISGTVTDYGSSVITLDGNVLCLIKNKNCPIEAGKTVTIQGRVVGYDDLMGELKLDQCAIIKPQTK